MGAVISGPLRIAFAGANAQRGWAKDAHLPAIRALGFELHAVSARDQRLADEAATAFGAAKAYGDTLAMMRDPDVDIVAVTVKVPEHRAIVLAALAAGKHLYCEWPLGRDVAEADELAAAARKAGVHVAIGLQGAWSPAVRHARKLVRQGAVGKLLSLHVISATGGWAAEAPEFYAYLSQRGNGATLAAIAGGHTMAAIEAVAGPYVDISAIGSIRHPEVRISGTDKTFPRDCADQIVVCGKHESGCLSLLEITGGAPKQPFSFQLRGSTGMLAVNGHHPGGFQCANLALSTSSPSPPMPQPAAPGLTGNPANVAEIYVSLAADIANGTRRAPDFAVAAQLTRLVAAIDPAPEDS